MNFHWCFRAIYGAEGECFELSAAQTSGRHTALFQGTPWIAATSVSFCTFGSLVAYTRSLLKSWKLCVCPHQIMDHKSETSMRGEQWGGVAVQPSRTGIVLGMGTWGCEAAGWALGGCCSVLWAQTHELLFSWLDAAPFSYTFSSADQLAP